MCCEKQINAITITILLYFIFIVLRVKFMLKYIVYIKTLITARQAPLMGAFETSIT